MLNKVGWSAPASSQSSPGAHDGLPTLPKEATIDLLELLRLVHRQWSLIAGILAAIVLAAIIYLAVRPAHYTATSLLLIDARQVPQFQQQTAPNAAIDSAYVDSQVEILKSEKVARSTINALNLVADPEFVAPRGGTLSLIGSLLGSVPNAEKVAPYAADYFNTSFGAASMDAERTRRAVAAFQSKLTIKRVGLTYVIQIDFRSRDASKAARISNGVTGTYIVDQLESKYETARRANSWLQDRINELKTQAQNAERAAAEFKGTINSRDQAGRALSEQELAELSNQRRIALKDLESSAQSYRALYETFLQRSSEAAQQQSFPAIEARVVAEASTPVEKSDPKPWLVLAVASALGLVGGLAAGLIRERIDPVLHSPSQVEKEFGVNCLGVFPDIGSAALASRSTDGRGSPEDAQHSVSGDEVVRLEQDDPPRVIPIGAARCRFVVVQPFSPLTEAIRSLKVAADSVGLGQRGRVIGISSALPREGKSVVAANLSALIAESGSRTLLIDCDLRSQGLTRQFAPEATEGLMEAIAGRASVRDLVWRDPDSAVEFLPVVRPFTPTLHPGWNISSGAMQRLLETVQEHYDAVILDLPPILPFVDVRAAAHLIDSLILVVAAGRTPERSVADALAAVPLMGEKLVGVVLNKNPNRAEERGFANALSRATAVFVGAARVPPSG